MSHTVGVKGLMQHYWRQIAAGVVFATALLVIFLSVGVPGGTGPAAALPTDDLSTPGGVPVDESSDVEEPAGPSNANDTPTFTPTPDSLDSRDFFNDNPVNPNGPVNDGDTDSSGPGDEVAGPQDPDGNGPGDGTDNPGDGDGNPGDGDGNGNPGNPGDGDGDGNENPGPGDGNGNNGGGLIGDTVDTVEDTVETVAPGTGGVVNQVDEALDPVTDPVDDVVNEVIKNVPGINKGSDPVKDVTATVDDTVKNLTGGLGDAVKGNSGGSGLLGGLAKPAPAPEAPEIPAVGLPGALLALPVLSLF